MRALLNILILLSFSVLSFAQSSEGGGAYIKNNGKLINSIVQGNYASDGFGVAGTSGEVTNCNITKNLYLNRAIMTPGDMYLSDGAIYTAEYDSNGNLVNIPDSIKSKIIGVCFWSNVNNDFINAQFWITSVDESSTKQWGPLTDISNLYNYQAAELILFDLDGVSNTDKILTGYGSSATIANCAAKYCRSYGTSSTVGSWFLPSGGQMRELLRGLSIVNNVLSMLGKTTVTLNANYWVSNEYSSTNGWSLSTPDGIDVTATNSAKSSTLRIRPMMIVQRSN